MGFLDKLRKKRERQALAALPRLHQRTARLRRELPDYEIGAGTSEIRRMLIGRELFAETM